MALTINFDKKVVLVTGGSRGIGRACVKLFSECGAQTIFSYNSNDDAASQTVEEFRNHNVYGFKIDRNSEPDIVSKISAIKSSFGKIDILVNNAGIWKRSPIDAMTLEQWRETISVNLTGNFLFTREISKLMKTNKFGRIINISSTAGQRGEAFYSHYAASKGGIISFTKSLAVELAPFNINVNCVAPGWVDTDMVAEVFDTEEKRAEVYKGIPVGKIATAEDIANSVVFLASPLADHITGEILNVNGGSVLCG